MDAPATRNGAPAEWLAQHLAVESTDECVMWPFALSHGYGVLRVGGVNRRVTHLVLEADGRSGGDGQEACHSCDNPPCVNVRHLRWDTRAGNVGDMFERGRETRTGRERGEDRWSAVLTADDVRTIRAEVAAGVMQTAMAETYGVSVSTVSRAVLRQTWKHVD